MPADFNRTLHKLRLRHFELLALLASERTVRAAARRMSLTQPAVSKMLREIETCYGGELFERSRTGIVPNALGAGLIRHAMVFVNELRAGSEEIDAIAGGAQSILRVGTLSVIPRVPLAIARLRGERPGVIFRVMEAKVVDLVRALVQGELDCIVGALPPELLQSAEADLLRIEPIADDRLCVVASHAHRLARSRRLGWGDLIEEAWVLPSRDSLLRRCIVDAHLLAGLRPPEPAVEMLSPVSMAALLVLDNSLLGVMRLEQAHQEHAMGRLRILPVAPGVALPPIALITRRDRTVSSEALIAFRKALAAAALPVPNRGKVSRARREG